MTREAREAKTPPDQRGPAPAGNGGAGPRDGAAGRPGDEPPPKRTIPFLGAQALCRVYTSTVFDLKVRGVHHVPRTGGVLLLSNHQSYLDPVLIGVRLPRPLSYMARSELFEANPLFTWLIRSLGAFPVRQGGSAAGAVKTAIARLRNGHALNIFPEGSRTEDGGIGPIEGGSALVVRGARVPVVPVVLDGSFQSWPRGRTIPAPHAIRMAYGPPMDLADLRPAEIVARVDRVLRTMFDELRGARGSLFDGGFSWNVPDDPARR